MQLIVLGMHRSGTSVLARLLNLMGAYFGPEGASTGANPENPRGFWERRDVRVLNDHVLHSVGCDWNRVLDFDPAGLPGPLVAEFSRRASRLVLEMDAHRPWLLKEPRLCLLFPLWRKLLDAPVCIHVHRHPVEVAASLHARNAIPVEAGLALWERYVRSALEASAGLPVVVVSHQHLMQQPCEAVRQLLLQLEVLGTRALRMPSDAEVTAFVQRDLYRQKLDRPDLLAYRNAPQVRLFEQLTNDSQPLAGPLGAMDSASERALADYETSLPPLQAKSDPARASVQGSHGEPSARTGGEEEGSAEHAFRREREQWTRKLAAAEDELRGAIEDRARLAKALDRAEGARVDAEQRVAERFVETGALTRMLLDRDRQVARLTARQRALFKLRDAMRAAAGKALADLQRKLAVADAAAANGAAQVRSLEALLQSTGARAARHERELARITGSVLWRMTAPLRAVARRFKGRRVRDGAGRAEMEEIMASGLFDAAWYLERNRDVADSGIEPAAHYLDYGALEGRDPGPAFDSGFYLARNPDVAAAGANPLLHFIRHGRDEGRLPHAGVARRR